LRENFVLTRKKAKSGESYIKCDEERKSSRKAEGFKRSFERAVAGKEPREGGI